MKVLKKEVKICEETSWEKVKVLDLQYSHRWEKGRILVRDYKDSSYNFILKQLRKEVKKNYDTFQENKEITKERKPK